MTRELPNHPTALSDARRIVNQIRKKGHKACLVKENVFCPIDGGFVQYSVYADKLWIDKERLKELEFLLVANTQDRIENHERFAKEQERLDKRKQELSSELLELKKKIG